MIHGRESNCRFCANHLGGQRCLAFPQGIPEILWSGENLHRAPYPGDGGIRYQPKCIDLTLCDETDSAMESLPVSRHAI